MERDRKFRALAIAAICVAVVGVSVAYAALQATLSIEGTTSVGTLTDAWNVHWENINVTHKDSSISWSGSGNYATGPFIEGDTVILWYAKFTAPNTSLTFTSDIVNEGSLNAKLLSGTYVSTQVETGSESSGIGDAFEYDVKVGSTDISDKQGSILLSGTTKTVTVTVKLKDLDNDTFNALNGKMIHFRLSLPFEQAADGEVTPTF